MVALKLGVKSASSFFQTALGLFLSFSMRKLPLVHSDRNSCSWKATGLQSFVSLPRTVNIARIRGIRCTSIFDYRLFNIG